MAFMKKNEEPWCTLFNIVLSHGEPLRRQELTYVGLLNFVRSAKLLSPMTGVYTNLLEHLFHQHAYYSDMLNTLCMAHSLNQSACLNNNGVASRGESTIDEDGTHVHSTHKCDARYNAASDSTHLSQCDAECMEMCRHCVVGLEGFTDIMNVVCVRCFQSNKCDVLYENAIASLQDAITLSSEDHVHLEECVQYTAQRFLKDYIHRNTIHKNSVVRLDPALNGWTEYTNAVVHHLIACVQDSVVLALFEKYTGQSGRMTFSQYARFVHDTFPDFGAVQQRSAFAIFKQSGFAARRPIGVDKCTGGNGDSNSADSSSIDDDTNYPDTLGLDIFIDALLMLGVVAYADETIFPQQCSITAKVWSVFEQYICPAAARLTATSCTHHCVETGPKNSNVFSGAMHEKKLYDADNNSYRHAPHGLVCDPSYHSPLPLPTGANMAYDPMFFAPLRHVKPVISYVFPTSVYVEKCTSIVVGGFNLSSSTLSKDTLSEAATQTMACTAPHEQGGSGRCTRNVSCSADEAMCRLTGSGDSIARSNHDRNSATKAEVSTPLTSTTSDCIHPPDGVVLVPDARVQHDSMCGDHAHHVQIASNASATLDGANGFTILRHVPQTPDQRSSKESTARYEDDSITDAHTGKRAGVETLATTTTTMTMAVTPPASSSVEHNVCNELHIHNAPQKRPAAVAVRCAEAKQVMTSRSRAADVGVRSVACHAMQLFSTFFDRPQPMLLSHELNCTSAQATTTTRCRNAAQDGLMHSAQYRVYLDDCEATKCASRGVNHMEVNLPHNFFEYQPCQWALRFVDCRMSAGGTGESDREHTSDSTQQATDQASKKWETRIMPSGGASQHDHEDDDRNTKNISNDQTHQSSSCYPSEQMVHAIEHHIAPGSLPMLEDYGSYDSTQDGSLWFTPLRRARVSLRDAQNSKIIHCQRSIVLHAGAFGRRIPGSMLNLLRDFFAHNASTRDTAEENSAESAPVMRMDVFTTLCERLSLVSTPAPTHANAMAECAEAMKYYQCQADLYECAVTHSCAHGLSESDDHNDAGSFTTLSSTSTRAIYFDNFVCLLAIMCMRSLHCARSENISLRHMCGVPNIIACLDIALHRYYHGKDATLTCLSRSATCTLQRAWSTAATQNARAKCDSAPDQCALSHDVANVDLYTEEKDLHNTPHSNPDTTLPVQMNAHSQEMLVSSIPRTLSLGYNSLIDVPYRKTMARRARSTAHSAERRATIVSRLRESVLRRSSSAGVPSSDCGQVATQPTPVRLRPLPRLSADVSTLHLISQYADDERADREARLHTASERLWYAFLDREIVVAQTIVTPDL